MECSWSESSGVEVVRRRSHPESSGIGVIRSRSHPETESSGVGVVRCWSFLFLKLKRISDNELYGQIFYFCYVSSVYSHQLLPISSEKLTIEEVCSFSILSPFYGLPRQLLPSTNILHRFTCICERNFNLHVLIAEMFQPHLMFVAFRQHPSHVPPCPTCPYIRRTSAH